MTTKLRELMAELSPADLKEVERRSRVHLKAMADARRLDEIRHAAKKTQGDIARAMGIGQNAVSQLEKRRDLQLSTLSRYVESVGFRLEVSIVADSGERIALQNFRPWESDKRSTGTRAASKRAVKRSPVPTPRKASSAREGAAAAKSTGARSKKPKR